MKWLLATSAMVFNLLDSLTTYLCLTSGNEYIFEANPIAAWAFEAIGLLPSLGIDAVVTLAVLYVLVKWRSKVAWGLLTGLTLLPLWAVINNISVMISAGILPL